MAHLTPEQLAGAASDPAYELSPEDRAHLAVCSRCRDEVTELGDLVLDVRAARTTEVRAPRPQVWAGVTRELADELRPASRRVPGPRRSRTLVAVAAAAGLVIGIGGTLGVQATRSPDAPALLASTVLAPLPGEAGQGTAELVRDRDTLQLRVRANLASSPGNHHEVWLINSDGRRMYALGVLPSSGDASYWLPPSLDARLDGYETVDISLEPEDGDAAHSQHSLVRGQLPG